VIVFYVVVVLVVLAVRDAPAMEGDKQGRMADVTEQVAQTNAVGESAVAAVVTHHEQTPAQEARDVPPEKLRQTDWNKRIGQRGCNMSAWR